jgi:hypothetical protein
MFKRLINFWLEKVFDSNQSLIIKAIFDERLANNWSNHDVAVKYAELAGSFVSYITLKKHFDSLTDLAPIKTPPNVQSHQKPVLISNRFDLLNDQPDIIEIGRVVANPSKIL